MSDAESHQKNIQTSTFDVFDSYLDFAFLVAGYPAHWRKQKKNKKRNINFTLHKNLPNIAEKSKHCGPA